MTENTDQILFKHTVYHQECCRPARVYVLQQSDNPERFCGFSEAARGVALFDCRLEIIAALTGCTTGGNQRASLPDRITLEGSPIGRVIPQGWRDYIAVVVEKNVRGVIGKLGEFL